MLDGIALVYLLSSTLSQVHTAEVCKVVARKCKPSELNKNALGRMLAHAYDFLREGGYMFLAVSRYFYPFFGTLIVHQLPLPCVANSRYLNFDLLKHITSALGFILLKERWKPGGKMGYWLFLKSCETTRCIAEIPQQFKKKYVLRAGKNRNNFAILL